VLSTVTAPVTPSSVMSPLRFLTVTVLVMLVNLDVIAHRHFHVHLRGARDADAYATLLFHLVFGRAGDDRCG